MRYMWIMIRGIFLMLLQSRSALVVAVPIAMLVSVGWFGSLAFRELWEQRSYAGGSYQDRDRFNLCVRAVTRACWACSLSCHMPALVAARFTTERDKKTWESLLMTSLTGAEILAAKTRCDDAGLAVVVPLADSARSARGCVRIHSSSGCLERRRGSAAPGLDGIVPGPGPESGRIQRSKRRRRRRRSGRSGCW